ncbi:unnamed protein product [Leptosia nina]|uniref:Chitooligosaccharidolytic beta-N-acetylglucosaminidase n=1 Tax=Leptosia nina TaxID=320188 RepID=A0AAV1JUL9_9NEOP
MDWKTSKPAIWSLLIPYLLLEHFMKTLSIVSYISMLGNYLNMAGLALIIYHIFLAPHGVVLLASTDPLALFFVIGTCLFNLSAVAVILSLDKALKNPKVLTQPCGMLTVGMFIPTVFTTVFGVLGYWSFGMMEENVLRSLPFDDYSAMAAIGLYLIAIAFAYPIQCYPAIAMIVDVIKNWNPQSTPSDELLKTIETTARPLFVMTSCMIFFPSVAKSNYGIEKEYRSLLTTNFFICYMIPIQGAFVAFVGNLCTTLLAFVFPAMMELCILQNLPQWTWECVNDKCVPNRATLDGKLQSLMTCNMLCASMTLWPQPTGHVSLSTTAVPVRADLFHLQILTFPSRPVREHIFEAFDIFQGVLRKMERGSRNFEEWQAVDVRVAVNESGQGDPRLRLDTDESYRFSLRPKNGTTRSLQMDVYANSFCGVRHAFETLSQIIWFDLYAGSLFMLEAANVDDVPRFRYRGLMLDTARNYFPVSDLLQTIDGMASCKLNTFHWHATDSQSFPVEFDSLPQLSRYGAYGPGAIYTTEDIRTVSHYARLRGIRVLLEVDLPAHVGKAWDWGDKHSAEKVLCLDNKPWIEYCNEPPCGQLNPRNVEVYHVMLKLYAEIMQLTGVDDMFHIGNDDVSQRCWAEEFNTTDPMDLWVVFTTNALQRLEAANGKLPNLTIMWSTQMSERVKLDLKPFLHKLGLQARDLASTQKYISGLRTIISHQDAWDINNGYSKWYEETGSSNYNSWQRVYEHRPWARKDIKYVEGGEATVWSSTLSTDGLDSRVWPRAAALAERLWSDRAEGATRPVHARLDIHRLRLKTRGIQVSPLWSNWCSQNPYTC